MSYGVELQIARARRRRELRDAARDELPAYRYLDKEDVLAYVEPHAVPPRFSALTVALMRKGLLALGYSEAEVVHRLGTDPWWSTDLQLRELLAAPDIAAKIEDQVVKDRPEGYEAGRGPAPVAAHLQSGMVGAPDPWLNLHQEETSSAAS